MRTKRALAITAVLVALAATGCGSDDDKGTGGGAGTSTAGGSAGSAGSAGSGDSKLPEAADMASVAAYLNNYTSCQNMQTGDRYDSNHEGSNDSWGVEEASDPSWGIKERAVCTDASGHPIALLTVPDMKKFQTAAKRDDVEFLVGQDFAVVPVGDEAVRDLTKSELMFLTCDRDFTAPSGYTKEPALVDGCVLSDYVPS